MKEKLVIDSTKVKQSVEIYRCDMCGLESPCILIMIGTSDYPSTCVSHKLTEGKAFRWINISEPQEFEIGLLSNPEPPPLADRKD